MLIPVEVSSFAIDPERNTPLIILKESGGSRVLPVSIDTSEAGAIAVHSLNVKTEKPFTIDLVKIIIEKLGGRLERVVIFDVLNQAFQARINICHRNSILIFECRTSDAIALALRCEKPIFVEDSVFEKIDSENTMSDKNRLKFNIMNVDTLDFGRYYLE